MKLSYSKAAKMATCGRQYYYTYELKLQSVETALAFPFGHAIDVPATEYIKAHALNQDFDIMSCFEEAWEKQMSGRTIRYPTTWDPESAYATAKRLTELFPEAWHASQLVAVVDEKGDPIVERFLSVPGPTGIELQLRLDAVVMDLRSGAVGPLDLKTAASAHTDIFGQNALQLTTYQYAVDYKWGDYLGPSQNVGYMEAIKRKVPSGKRGIGPTWEPPSWYPRRSDDAVRSMLKAYANIGQDIRNKRFDPPFALAFNSPCNMCDFADLCVRGDSKGLEKRVYRN